MSERTDTAEALGEEWLDVCSLSDLEDGAMTCVRVGSREVTALRLGDRVHLLPARCPHRGGPLYEGTITYPVTAEALGQPEVDRDRPMATCPWHNWQFDPETGRTLVASKVRLPVFTVRITDGRVQAQLKKNHKAE